MLSGPRTRTRSRNQQLGRTSVHAVCTVLRFASRRGHWFVMAVSLAGAELSAQVEAAGRATVGAAPALPAAWPLPTSTDARSSVRAADSTREPFVAIGTRIRVWELAAHDLSIPVVGRLARVTSDSVDIRPDGDESPLAVPRPRITRVESSLGPHSGSRSTTALTGAAIGALGGGILGIIAGNLSRSNAARLGIYSGIGGAGAGAVAGAAMPGEAWRGATLPAG
jgi:hypothetical protein